MADKVPNLPGRGQPAKPVEPPALPPALPAVVAVQPAVGQVANIPAPVEAVQPAPPVEIPATPRPEVQPVEATLPMRKPEPPLPPGFCRPSDRATAGQQRFRIRADIPGGSHPAKYVLARSQAEAEAKYVAGMNLQAESEIKDRTGKPVLKLAVVALPD